MSELQDPALRRNEEKIRIPQKSTLLGEIYSTLYHLKYYISIMLATATKSLNTNMCVAHHKASSAAKITAPFRLALSSAVIRSTSYVSDASMLKSSKRSMTSVRCRSSTSLAVRSEISYVMVKPDGTCFHFMILPCIFSNNFTTISSPL